MKLIKLIPIVALILIAGCGLVSDEKADDNSVYGLEQQGACTLGDDFADRFSRLFEVEIQSEANCLQKSLEDYADLVRRQNPNYINRVELSDFVRKFFPKDAEKIIDVLVPAFKVNSLLLKDPEDNLSLSNIPLLIDFLKVLNRYGILMTKEIEAIFEKAPTDRDETDEERKERKKRNAQRYWQKKDRLIFIINKFAENILEIVRKRPVNAFFLDIMGTLDEIKDVMDIGDDELDLEVVESFLFAKKLLFGGKAGEISTGEMERIIERAPTIAETFLDVVFVAEKEFADDVVQHRFYLEMVSVVKDQFYDWDIEEIILHHDDLIVVFQNLLKDIDWNNMSESIKNFKEKILGGRREIYSFGDFLELVNIVRDAAEISYFNFATYRHYRHIMAKPQPITKLEKPNLEEYDIIPNNRIEEMWKNFLFVAKYYHFFIDKDGYSQYSYDIKRNAYGFNLNSITRWGFKKFFIAYGHIDSVDGQTGSGEFVLSLDEARDIAISYKAVLEELKMWPDDLERLLNELQLGSDLFRMNSNGDMTIQLDEVNEYIGVIIGTTKMSKEITDGLLKYCTDISEPGTEDPAYELDCYRRNYFRVMFTDLGYDAYFPNLRKWQIKQSEEKLYDLFKTMEIKGRIVNDPELPMDKVDIGRLLTSMINSETLFIRHDTNKNGELKVKGGELDSVFKIAENIIADADPNLKPGKKLTRSAFLYVVKKERLPKPGFGGTLDLLRFHIWPFKNGITADRMTIAKVLSNF